MKLGMVQSASADIQLSNVKGQDTPVNPAAEMYRVDPGGSKTLLAVLNDDKKWVRVKDGG